MRKSVKLLVLLLALTVLIYGCDGQDIVVDDNDDGNGDELDDQPIVPVDDSPGDDSSGALDELKNFILGSTEYMVVYDYDFIDMEITLTQYVKGNRIRSDSAVMGMQTRTYILDGSVVTCMQQEGSWMCFETEIGEIDDTQAGADPISGDIETGTFDGTVEPLPDRTVAGLNAKCFRVTQDEYSYTYCYSSQGIPLLMEGDSEAGTWRMIATEVSDSVSDSVFELPAEPGSINDMMGGWGVPGY